MRIDPMLVEELRARFREGATPTALIRRIAERHADETRLDGLVRQYFRDAFQVPLVRVGPEALTQIRDGVNLPALNASIVYQLIQSRGEWNGDGAASAWMDGIPVTTEAELVATAEPERIPELSEVWNRMDDSARLFIQRIIGGSRSLQEKLNAMAALAEQLQKQLDASLTRPGVNHFARSA